VLVGRILAIVFRGSGFYSRALVIFNLPQTRVFSPCVFFYFDISRDPF